MSNTRGVGSVLIITLTGDVHVQFVTRHLKRDYVLVDPAVFVDGDELSYVFNGHMLTSIYRGEPLENIASVWYRRPYIPEPEDLEVDTDYKDYAHSSIRRHILNLYGLFQGAYWLSDYYTLLRAEAKPRQLELAAQLGFNVPKTLFTSDSKAAARFIAEHGTVVAKSMASTLPVVDGKVQYFYTTKISSKDHIDLGNLNTGPAIFQKAIDVAQGLRITVVGDQVFTAAVCDQSHRDYPDIIDWRRAYTGGKTRFVAYDLPKKLQDQCVALTKAFDLSFGAIDIMLDTKGDYWFLEINPNGQWAFVEEDTDLPIGKAIARLLETDALNG